MAPNQLRKAIDQNAAPDALKHTADHGSVLIGPTSPATLEIMSSALIGRNAFRRFKQIKIRLNPLQHMLIVINRGNMHNVVTQDNGFHFPLPLNQFLSGIRCVNSQKISMNTS